MSNKFDITKENILVERLTPADSWIAATRATVGGKELGKRTTWKRMLDAGHSPIRSVWFRVTMEDIPSFVSTHFVRHKIGIDPYVKSNRDDRCGDGTEDRNTPVLHVMDCNAQALMTMAHVRLCGNAHEETQKVMREIVHKVGLLDPDLASLMVPMCEYRGGVCHEIKCCGYCPSAYSDCKGACSI